MAMLNTIGAASVDDFYEDVPESARLDGKIHDLPDHQGELAVERHLARLAAKNTTASDGPFFVGARAYKHHVPASVDMIIQRSEFLTTYTPYQPEIAQGTLQTLFEFQTQVPEMTAMDVANASMYDGSTSCAEAAVMACRVTPQEVVLSGGLHPHYAAATRLLCEAQGIEVVSTPAVDGELELANHVDDETACVIGQSPNVFGTVTDCRRSQTRRMRKKRFWSACSPKRFLGLVTPPGEMGADIAVGEGQSIGNPLTFGGPYVGLFACTQKLVRQMPGRLCGETVDADGEGLRADALDPRATYSPGQSDLKYLYKFRTLRLGVHCPHDLARWHGVQAARRAQS